MSTEFRTDSLESEELIAADQPDSTMLIEVDTANPSPMTIAIAEAIAYILATRDRSSSPHRNAAVADRPPDSQPSTSSKAQPTLSHHTRHRTICHHPERQAIEEEFIHWHSPKTIAVDHAIGVRSVYRHARALGLFARRAIHLRDALGHIIEKVQGTSITSDAVVRAVYAHSHLSSTGRWVEERSLVVTPGRSMPPGLLETPVE